MSFMRCNLKHANGVLEAELSHTTRWSRLMPSKSGIIHLVPHL